MTPAEKEQLWNCIMKMRSMPWKGPRGGTYNWDYRHMRKLYEKLVVYGDNNQPAAAWRLLNEGKYKYMIYPWYKAQLFKCISFAPASCVYTATVMYPFGTFDDVSIYDVDTSTTIAGSLFGDWTTMFVDLQALGYLVWGNCGPARDRLVIYIESPTPPNWGAHFEKKATGAVDIPLVWTPVSCVFDIDEAYQHTLFFSTCGGFASIDADYELTILGQAPNDILLTPNINLSNTSGLQRALYAIFGPQIIPLTLPETPTGSYTLGACGLYNVGYSPIFPLQSTFVYVPGALTCYGTNIYPIPTCAPCYWTSYGSVPYPVSGYTINGLDADDPASYVTLGGLMGGYGFSSIDPLSGIRYFCFNVNTGYADLITIDVGPGVAYIQKPFGWSAPNPTCQSGCMELVVPSTDQYLANLYEALGSVKIDFYNSYIFGPMDLADNVFSSSILTQIYQALYGAGCTAQVTTLPSGDFQIRVFNTWYAPPFSGPYMESALLPGTYYYFVQIACP